MGLILLGLLDGFLLPILPGSMDIATIFLAAHDQKLWFYYAAMATAGSVLGGRKNNSRTALTRGPIGYWRHVMDCQVLAVPEKNGGERRTSIKSLMSVPGMLFCRRT